MNKPTTCFAAVSAAVATCLALAAPAGATPVAAFPTVGAAGSVVFSDNFDSYAQGLTLTSLGSTWTVSGGNVDVIGTGFFDLQPGNGNYVDLDGTGGTAGRLSTTLALLGGMTYGVDFVLGGNARNAPTDTVDVGFGTTLATYSLAGGAPLALYSLSFTPLTSGNYSLFFDNQGADNQGALLLSVAVTNAVPEPASLALVLLAGAAAATAGRRGRRP